MLETIEFIGVADYCNAKVAQLVEHDLAKVGVAGSSPVFRSKDARVVELVDTQDLKSCVH